MFLVLNFTKETQSITLDCIPKLYRGHNVFYSHPSFIQITVEGPRNCHISEGRQGDDVLTIE